MIVRCNFGIFLVIFLADMFFFCVSEGAEIGQPGC